MITMDEIIEMFKTAYPLTAEKYVGWEYDTRTDEIIINLNDGSKIVYEPRDNSIRNYGALPTATTPEDDFQHEFAKRLTDKLVRSGMTQMELSEATGISRQSIGRYINGSAMPSLSSLISIAKALNCQTSEFID